MSRALDRLRERLWFWPLVAGLAAAAAAEALVRLDRALDDRDARPFWVFSGTAAAARDVLSTIATATMTVLGVTLTITLAVLALTAQGYSPRALRRFMRDPVVQIVIAGFVGAFAFALVALRLVREDEVPGITVNVAVALAFVVLGLLVWFFHHLASEIRVERLIEAVWSQARLCVERLPAERSAGGDAPVAGPLAAEARARRSGRVVWIDEGAAAAVARRAAGSVAIVRAPGDFVAEGETVAQLLSERPSGEDEVRALEGAVVLDTERTMTQDAAFGLRQLADIALRALSPGVNDPTTAEEAILRLADLLRRAAGRRLGSRVLADDGRVLVDRPRPTWDDLVGLAFDQIAAAAEAQSDAATARALLDAIGRVAAATDDPSRLAALRRRARRVRDGARRSLADPDELARIEAAAAPLD